MRSSASANPQTRTLRDRLQMAAFAMVVLVGALATTMHLGGPATSPFGHLFGDDLVPSYMAGTFIREGRPDLLHDYAAAERFQTELRQANGLQEHGRTGPWLNPPFYAAIFVPLSALPYRAALWTWFGLNLLMLSASIVLLYRMLPAEKRRPADGAIIAGLLIASMPALQAMACQQNTFLSLLILCGAITLARKDRPFAAGAVAALLLFKPQLAVIVCGALACTLGWRAIAGMAASSAVLLIATAVILPGTIGDYLHKLPALLPYLRTDRPYPWERQTTFLGFWRMLLDGRTGGANPPAVTILWLVGAAAVAITLIGPLWKAFVGTLGFGQAGSKGEHRTSNIENRTPKDDAHFEASYFGVRCSMFGVRGSRLRADRLLAATIAASPLLMPYYMDYDLLLLAVPAVLLAAERMATGRQAGDRWLIAGWIAIYLWMYVNAAVADATGVSVIVLLMLVRFLMPVRTVWDKWQGRSARDSSLSPEQLIRDTGFQPVPATLKSSDEGSLSASHRRHGLEARVTDAPFKLPVILAVVAVGLALLAGVADRSSPLTFGHDLLPGYVAGRMVIAGRAPELYDVAATRGVGRAIIATENLTKDPSHILWLNPPAFAWLFAPLAALPYRVALLVWLGLNVAVGTAALRAILRWATSPSPLYSVERAGARGRTENEPEHRTPNIEHRTSIQDERVGLSSSDFHVRRSAFDVRRSLYGLTIAALVLTSCPFLLAVEHQQTTFLSLGILTAAVIAWRTDRPMLAGLLVGLLSLKPQLAFAVGLTLWIMEGRRALAGMVISAVALAAAGEMLSPGSTRDFLANVPAAAASLQLHPGYNWGRQMTPTAFMRTLLGADSHVATIAGHAVSAAILVVVGWKAWTLRQKPNDRNRVRAIVLALLAMPLCAPYFMDYDLLLLLIPMALLLKDGHTKSVAIGGLSLWLLAYLNVDIVAVTGMNGVVLLSLVILAMLIRSMARIDRTVGVEDLRPGHPLTLQSACP